MNNAIRNIHPNAKIGRNVKIGAFVTIEEDVIIGDGTEIHPNVCVLNGVRMGEKMGLPRERFWDSLVKVANVKSYHFEDYDQFKDLVCPEESHLSLNDANFFTTELIKTMKADGALAN